MTPWVSWRLKGAAQRGVACWDSSCSSHWVSSPHPPGLLCSPPAQCPQWLVCTDSVGRAPWSSGPWLAVENPKREQRAQGPQSACVPQPAVTGPVGVTFSPWLSPSGPGGLKRFRPQALWGQKWLVSSLWMSLYTLTPRLAPKRHSVSTLCMHALGMPH